MNSKNVIIENDKELISGEEYTFHFTYEENLTLKELTDLLDLTNKSINDYNREYGKINNIEVGNKYAPKITKVSQGSINVSLILQIVEVAATLTMLGFAIYDRVKNVGASETQKKNGEMKYPVYVKIDGKNNTIDIHIDNGKSKK